MNIPIWPGSSSFVPNTGQTPFGFYDNDPQFQADADKVANFCARRMGYPIMDIELQDINFYTAFEEAVTTYGNEVYSVKVQDNYLSLEGASSTQTLNNSLITPTLSTIVRIAQAYGTEAGVGGNIDYKRGFVTMSQGVQDYDLNQWAVNNGINSGDIEIRRIYYEAPPAITRYFDPYAGTGTGMIQLLDTFGWGNYSPAINFMLMPINYDLQKIQAIEFNDQIRKSQYSFELINNKVRIFPIPDASMANNKVLWFQYLLKSDRDNSGISSGNNLVTNVSNVPYANPVYSEINSIGRQWIFEYALAIAKEMLGLVRGKYDSLPIPGAEAKLNAPDLLTQANNDKTALITRLREYLGNTSRKTQLENRAAEVDARQKELQQVPFTIYIG
jgi:hypothetical protein